MRRLSDRTLGFAALCLVIASLFAVPFSSARAQSTSSSAAAPQGATITFQKIFKSSYPEYVLIKVNEDGAGTWDIRQLDETPDPQPLQIGQALAHKIFDLAAQLHNFDGVDLDVHRRIASLGQKTLRYEKGAEVHEATFNYTLNNTADQLVVIFGGLERQELDLSDMERSMHYDRLGINDVILRVQTDVKNKLIPEPQVLLPVLDQIAADSDLIDIARQRARAIAEQIREGR
jgi:hypothetical protein